MKNIIYNGTTYERIFINGEYIIKYSRQNIKAWQSLQNKKLSFLNIPTEYYELTNDEKNKYNAFSKICLPYLQNYETLYGNIINDSEKTLLLLKKLLEYIKIMHKNSVFHGDIFSQNIMINDSLDVSLIDLDAAIIDNVISDENVYFEDQMSLDEKKNMTMIDDKLGILNLFLYYFINNSFDVGVDYYVDYKKLGLNQNMTKEIINLNNGNIETNYYFLDIVEELIKNGYDKAPKVL